MFKNKIIHPLLFLVISIILFLIINKNNLFKNYITNINDKYDNILNIFFNNQNNFENNFENNSENNYLEKIQSNSINNINEDLSSRQLQENFSLNPITNLKSTINTVSDVSNSLKQKLVSSLVSPGTNIVTGAGQKMLDDLLPTNVDLNVLDDNQQKLIDAYHNNKIKDEKYKLHIDENTTCSDLVNNAENSPINYLQYYNGKNVPLKDNLMFSCQDSNGDIRTGPEICNNPCPEWDNYPNPPVYGSINNDLSQLKNIRTKLSDTLDANKTVLSKLLNEIHQQSDKDKAKNLREITALRQEIKGVQDKLEKTKLDEDKLSQIIGRYRQNTSNLYSEIDKKQMELNNANVEIKQLSKNTHKYDIYEDVVSFGKYGDNTGLAIPGIPVDNKCYNVSEDKAKELCDDNDKCDGFFRYNIKNKDKLERTCFKQNLFQNIHNSDGSLKKITELREYPGSGTYLKNINNCNGLTGSYSSFNNYPCNIAYDNVKKKDGIDKANDWCRGDWNKGCTLNN